MKDCQICNRQCHSALETCPGCGEASWTHKAVEPDPATITDPITVTEPIKRKRK